MSDENELERGRIEPRMAYSERELAIWWLVAAVLRGSARYEQQMAANRALARVLNSLN